MRFIQSDSLTYSPFHTHPECAQVYRGDHNFNSQFYYYITHNIIPSSLTFHSVDKQSLYEFLLNNYSANQIL